MTAIAEIPVHMKQLDVEALERKVKRMYKEVAEHPEERFHFEMGRALAERLGYPKEELDNIPVEAIESFAGVGYFFDLIDLREGHIVVDLGSGSGMDAFYASNKVGETGEVFGIDMTQEQLFKSRAMQVKGTFEHTYFLESHIEELPIIPGTIDAVISNGVINLSRKKDIVFKEAFRVLKPGGKLVISDIISTKKLPESITSNATLWASCIGGALPVNEYYGLIEQAGFEIMKVKRNPYKFISKSAKGATKQYGIHSVSLLAVKKDDSNALPFSFSYE